MDKIKLLGWAIMLLFFAPLFVFFLLGFMDYFTIEDTGTEIVKCIDKDGAEFVDEWCEIETTCSWLGFKLNADARCKDVGR